MQKFTKNLIKSLIIPRQTDSHKGTHGRVLLVAGAIGKMGAAVIASRACLRSGAGILFVNVPIEERHILQIALPEAMLVFREESCIDLNGISTVAIGPGIGVNENSEKLLIEILTNFKGPILLDADALNIVATKNLLGKVPKGTILTPHLKEFDRWR